MQEARVKRLNSLIKDQLSAIIHAECDWTHPLMVSVTEVDTAPDLSHSRIKIHLMGTPEQRSEALILLKREGAHLRYILAQRIELRKMPYLRFELDGSIEDETRLLELIDQANKPK